MNNKNFFVFVIVFFISSFFLWGTAFPVSAVFSPGWHWGGTESLDDAYSGIGWIQSNWDTKPGDNDNVNIPPNDGNVTGYAWTEHYGWIDFSPSEPYPSDPRHSVKRIGDKLYGWARIVSIANNAPAGISGGWEGWIKFGDISKGDLYEVTISSTSPPDATYESRGYAYSDELGYIDFSGLGETTATSSVIEINLYPTNNVSTIRLNEGEEASDKSVTLNWKVITGTPTSCTASSIPLGLWSGNPEIPSGNSFKSASVPLSGVSNTFTLTCSDGVETDTKSIIIRVGCYNSSCSGGSCSETFSQTNTYNCVRSCENNSGCSSEIRFRQREVAP